MNSFRLSRSFPEESLYLDQLKSSESLQIIETELVSLETRSNRMLLSEIYRIIHNFRNSIPSCFSLDCPSEAGP